MTLAEKIVKQLKDEHGIEFRGTPSIARTRAGHWQRSAGAWSWFLMSDTDHKSGCIGSQYPASHVVQGFTATLHIGDIHLDPHEYVLKCNDLYIKRGGFTKDLKEAKRYESKKAARRDQAGQAWVITQFAPYGI